MSSAPEAASGEAEAAAAAAAPPPPPPKPEGSGTIAELEGKLPSEQDAKGLQSAATLSRRDRVVLRMEVSGWLECVAVRGSCPKPPAAGSLNTLWAAQLRPCSSSAWRRVHNPYVFYSSWHRSHARNGWSVVCRRHAALPTLPPSLPPPRSPASRSPPRARPAC